MKKEKKTSKRPLRHKGPKGRAILTKKSLMIEFSPSIRKKIEKSFNLGEEIAFKFNKVGEIDFGEILNLTDVDPITEGPKK